MPRSAPSAPGAEHPLHSLYAEHHAWLQAWMRRRLGCPEQAADLSHDTFVRVLSSRKAFDLSEPRALLTTLAQRVLFSFWRRRSLEQAWVEALAAQPPEYALSAEDSALVREAVEMLDGLLEGLPVRARQAFVLCRLEEMTHPQIAARLGVSLATVERDMRLAYRHCYAASLQAD